MSTLIAMYPGHMIARDGDKTIALVSINDRINNPSLRSATSNVYSSIRVGAESINKMQEMQYPLPQMFDNYRKTLTTTIAPATRTLVTTLREANTANKATRANLLLPRTPIDPLRASIKLQMLIGKKPAKIIEMAHKDATGEIGAIMFDNWDTLEMPDVMRGELEKSVARTNAVNRFAQTAARRKPTPQDILADGPDMELATQMADAAIRDLDAATDEIHAVRNWVFDAINHISVAANITPSAAMSAVLSEAA
ncbi:MULTISPECIES: hypothetical protein [unclassified Mesorhizobium]|uniref:hypothetical protein n=1 Tax=unclassified Mesorhizobium TaxID=325217 RepID=UPI00333A2EFA